MSCIEPNNGFVLCWDITDVGAATYATIIIAVLTLCVFVLQYRQHRHNKIVTNANYQIALFDKRMETYHEVRQVMTNFFRDGQPSLNDAFKLRNHAQTARFLFPTSVISFLETIADKAFEHHKHGIIWEPLRKRSSKGEELTEQEIVKRDSALDAKHEIEDWFLDLVQSAKFSNVIDPHLKLPDKL